MIFSSSWKHCTKETLSQRCSIGATESKCNFLTATADCASSLLWSVFASLWSAAFISRGSVWDGQMTNK